MYEKDLYADDDNSDLGFMVPLFLLLLNFNSPSRILLATKTTTDLVINPKTNADPTTVSSKTFKLSTEKMMILLITTQITSLKRIKEPMMTMLLNSSPISWAVTILATPTTAPLKEDLRIESSPVSAKAVPE